MSPSSSPALAAGVSGMIRLTTAAGVRGQAEFLRTLQRHGIEADADPGLSGSAKGGLPGRDQFAGDTPDGIGRQRETEADTAAVGAGTEDRGVEADQLPVDIGERSAGVPPIDRSVRLDRAVKVPAFVQLQVAAVQGADHTHRHG